jgi:PEP-CTERM motif
VIRLDFGVATFVKSIGLSSLDSGTKDGFAIFDSDTEQPTLSSLTAIAQGTNSTVGSINPIITTNQFDRYFFVTSLNRTTSDSGSDFLLESVTATPEPYTSAMLGLGLLAIGAALRLRIARQR